MKNVDPFMQEDRSDVENDEPEKELNLPDTTEDAGDEAAVPENETEKIMKDMNTTVHNEDDSFVDYLPDPPPTSETAFVCSSLMIR